MKSIQPYILPTVAVLIVITSIRFLSRREPFSLIGTNKTGDPIENVSYQEPAKPIINVPDAYTLSQRNQMVHQTEMSCMEQISNHRRPDEYATADNGTAKPFEMSSEFFHQCDTNSAVPRKVDFTMPAEQTTHGIRVGAFRYLS